MIGFFKMQTQNFSTLCLPDNAYDPDVNAKQIWIDKTVINDRICLTFTDNGNGMTADKLHKMLRYVKNMSYFGKWWLLPILKFTRAIQNIILYP